MSAFFKLRILALLTLPTSCGDPSRVESEEALTDDTATTGQGISVGLPVLSNDSVTRIRELGLARNPQHGTAEWDAARERLHYTPPPDFYGVETFSYVVTRLDGAAFEATVTVTVEPGTWTLVGGRPFHTIEVRVADDHPAREPHEDGVWLFDVDADRVAGFRGPAERESAFWMDLVSGNSVSLALPPSRAHHFGPDGSIVGSLGAREASAGVVWSSEGDAHPLSFPEVTSSELFGIDSSGTVVGYAKAGIPPDDLPFPLMSRDSKRLEDVPVPEGSSSAIIHAIDDDGLLVGTARIADTERAFVVERGAAAFVELDGAFGSRAYDTDQEGVVVGTYRTEGAWEAGFRKELLGAGFDRIEHDAAISTRVFGMDPTGAFAGSFLDASGYSHGFVLLPIAPAPAPGTQFAKPPEAPNPLIAHACAHSMEGPFRVVTAAPSITSAPAMDAAHTSYTILLPEPGPRSLLHWSPGPGPVSFLANTPVALRLYDAESRQVPLAVARRTSSCPAIRWVHQFELPAQGDYHILLEAAPGRDKVSIIVERAAAY